MSHIIKCDICDFVCFSEGSFMDHLKSEKHKEIYLKIRTCPHCSEVSETISLLTHRLLTCKETDPEVKNSCTLEEWVEESFETARVEKNSLEIADALCDRIERAYKEAQRRKEILWKRRAEEEAREAAWQSALEELRQEDLARKKAVEDARASHKWACEALEHAEKDVYDSQSWGC